MALAGNAIHYMLRKSDPPRKRKFNADGWIAIPDRSPDGFAETFKIEKRIESYFTHEKDYDYGCDERLQTELAKFLLSKSSLEYRMFRPYAETLVDEASGTEYNYDSTQRVSNTTSKLNNRIVSRDTGLNSEHSLTSLSAISASLGLSSAPHPID